MREIFGRLCPQRHELKNSLALVKGATYILSKTDQNPTDLAEINTISEAADEAEEVINTLLDYSKGELGGRELIHVGTIIRQILLLSKKETIQKNIKIRLNIDNKCYVDSTSREALKVIMQNIIINAIQAVDDDGTIVITCKKNDYYAFISIKDDGPAITKEVMERIFEPFYTTKEDGNGVGLWISKRIANSLGGNIIVAVDEDDMTEFDITLPINSDIEGKAEQ